jgi:predicted dehydrogenase
MNVLLIGCGNIGALYDWDIEAVKTHCKALSKLPNVIVSVYDNNIDLATKVAKKYNFLCVENENQIVLQNYKWVVIASPTNSHLPWLCKCFDAEVPLVICEKPIAKNEAELSKLESLYTKSKTKVIVNFIRRFQPAYAQLKKDINNKIPSNVIIKYQRGLVNNFSHAADLLNYFFGGGVFENIHVTQKVFDEFEDDPTVSFTALFNKIPINVIGLAKVKYSYFEIELFFEDEKISIINNGNDIVYQKALHFNTFYEPLPTVTEYKEKKLLNNYMQFVYDSVIQMYKNIVPDNYVEALKMNQQLLQIIQ